MATYRSIADALNDPQSNAARLAREAQQAQQRNALVIDALMAQGMTREQAWARMLASMRPATRKEN